MKIVQLTVDDVEWVVEAEQDDLPVRGNAIASGDDEVDKRVEEEIIERIENGDVWAWASVCVRGRFKGLEATTYLGGCCYRDEDEFCQAGGYFDDMQKDVLSDLQDQLEELVEAAINGL